MAGFIGLVVSFCAIVSININIEGDIMDIIITLNHIISVVFFLCYLYQLIYLLVGLFGKEKNQTAKKNHRYGVIVSARDEEKVVGLLIDSIKKQTYPEELIDVFVVADNCSDQTAKVAEAAGAKVYERKNPKKIGKGYALNFLFQKINKEYGYEAYDAFIVFDADNVIAPIYIEEMNKVFDSGYRIITSYRNSKNYGKNWISAGYSLWFLREARYLNKARMKLGTSCAVSGTGFLVSREIIQKNDGWVHHLLTEDIEFTTDNIIAGEKIGYCGKAVLYDEQPVKFGQSYRQRLRWAKGFYQVLRSYGRRLIQGVFSGSFGCYDMLMTIMPAMILTFLSIVINLVAFIGGWIAGISELSQLYWTVGRTLVTLYITFFFMGTVTTITEWKKIYCPNFKKILYLFSFPLFMLTYVPISIIALFVKVEWKHIDHDVATDVEHIQNFAEHE